MNDKRSPDLETRARRVYRQAAADVDPRMAARLRAVRRTALAGGGRAPARRPYWMMPAGALAVAVLAVALTWQPLQQHRQATPAAQPAPSEASSDLPPDPDNTDPTMYQNLDFYAWLANQPNHAQVR